MSNFDQFFVGLPISLYQRPRRISVVPRVAEGVVRFVPVFPPGKAYQASQPGLGRFRLQQEIHIIESSRL